MFLGLLAKTVKDRRGQDLIEYALLIGLFTAVAVSTFPSLVPSLQAIYDRLMIELVRAAGS
jgi:Flp pilus assembly pilin Flp